MSGRPPAERPMAPRRGPGGPMFHGMPGGKAAAFGPSFRRLLGWLRPERARLAAVAAAQGAVVGFIVLSVLLPIYEINQAL